MGEKMLGKEDKKDEKEEEGGEIINYSNQSEIQLVLLNKHLLFHSK